MISLSISCLLMLSNSYCNSFRVVNPEYLTWLKQNCLDYFTEEKQMWRDGSQATISVRLKWEKSRYPGGEHYAYMNTRSYLPPGWSPVLFRRFRRNRKVTAVSAWIFDCVHISLFTIDITQIWALTHNPDMGFNSTTLRTIILYIPKGLLWIQI